MPTKAAYAPIIKAGQVSWVEASRIEDKAAQRRMLNRARQAIKQRPTLAQRVMSWLNSKV